MDEKIPLLARLRAGWKNPDKRARWIVILGAAGILLIFFSSIFGGREKAQPAETGGETTAAAYAASIRDELSEMIAKISGAGKTEVMVTLQNDGETLYAKEEQTERDSVQSAGKSISERESRDEAYVMVDGTDGRSALVRTRMEPVIKGVVVVCEGGDDPVTVSRIMDAVTTALAISSAKVCITKLA